MPSGPAVTRNLVARNGLFDRLAQGRPGDVTLISAPAGSGKTTLLRSWIDRRMPCPYIAWVSVARNECDAQRFWLGVVTAISDAIGQGEWKCRPTVQSVVDADVLVDSLVADLAALDEPVLVVIDDLHELLAPGALEQLERLLVQRPTSLRVVLATRSEPALGLHRLRLTGDLTELRAADLCFTMEETRELLHKAGISLPEESVKQLQERTEGWAAGLRLAVISLLGHPDQERLVTEFSGSARAVADFLLAEVLDRQPDDVRNLLLSTSILNRISGPLADALTGQLGSERILQELEDANAFVTSLDGGRTWFRYHHLFADLLQLELRRMAPERLRELHRAAAEWFEREGFLIEAIEHAQAAGDWERAACLLTDDMDALRIDLYAPAIRSLLSKVPADVSLRAAERALLAAIVEIRGRGPLEDAIALFETSRQLAETVPDDRRDLFDFALVTHELVLASRSADLPVTLENWRMFDRLLDAVAGVSSRYRRECWSVGYLYLGIAQLWSGHLDDARAPLEQGLALARQAKRAYMEIGCLGHLALAAPTVERRVQLSAEALEVARRHGWSADPAAAVAHVAMGGALVWTGRFADAEDQLDQAAQALRPEAEPATGLALHYARGLLLAGRQELQLALDEFRIAAELGRHLAEGHWLADELLSATLHARVRLGESEVVRAEVLSSDGWEEHADLRTVVAAAALADGAPDRASQVLAPVLDGVDADVCLGTRLLAVLLHAVAQDRLGMTDAAEATVERALELAEPDRLILPFALVPVQHLLERHPGFGTAHAALASTALEMLGDSPALLRNEFGAAELRVVGYLPSNLTVSEIAAELCVSVNTVKTHLRRVYAKLGAHRRSEAVDRARRLGLLAPSARRRAGVGHGGYARGGTPGLA